MRIISILKFAVFGIFLSNAVKAQTPVNDLCSTATPVTNTTVINGNLSNATDNFIGLIGCQGLVGVHPDVFYSFTATGSQATFNVIAGTLGGEIEVTILQGNCAGAYTVIGSQCGVSPITGSINGLFTGGQYYMVVSSGPSATAGTFSGSLTTTNPVVVAAQDCSTAAPLCGAQTSFFQGSSVNGTGLVQEVSTSNSCWGSGGERQSKWFKFTIAVPGLLQFNINPVNPQDDYDWGIWDVTNSPTGCVGIFSTPTLSCNWSGADGSTGLSICTSQEPGFLNSAPWGDQDSGQQLLFVQADHTYALLVDNFSTTNSGFTLIFGGACGSGPGVLAEIANVDATYSYTNTNCGTYNFTGNIPAGIAGYTAKWNFGDGTISTLPNPTHTYATGDAYTVTYTITSPTGCIATSSQTLIVPLTLELKPDADTCTSVPVNLNARNLANFSPTAYTWAALGGITGTFNQLNDSTLEVFPRRPTTYQVNASALNCRDSLTVRVIPTVSPTAVAVPSTGILPLSVDFTPTNLVPAQDGFAFDSVRWDFGDNSPSSTDPAPTHLYDSLGVFYVTLTAIFEGGCSQTDTVTVVSVFPGTIPNIITPDGDGLNDKLVLKFTNQAVELKVFNRWGNIVYENSDYKQDWSPKDLPSGIYFYQVLNSKPEAGRPAGYKGWLDIHQ